MIDVRSLAAALGGDISGRDSVRAPGPGHSPADRSLSIKVDLSAPGGFVVKSFADDDPILCKDYVRERAGLPPWEPVRRHPNVARKPIAKAGSAPAEYIYKQADGTPYLRVVRPGFFQSHWDGSAWVSGAPKGPKIPYRLPELLHAEHETVLIVEGEKDADNVAALGFTVTTNSCGAGKWTADLNQYFKDRDIYILPDNDEAGEKHAKQICESLAGTAREVRVVRLPGLGDKQDVSDWIKNGGTADDLARLMDAAPRFEAAAPAALIQPSAEFVGGFVPPDYLIDGLLQRRFVYSLTAPTGSGKTAVLLLLCASVALGRAIGEYQPEKGRVLYLAGENPDDVRMRWLAMSDAMGFDTSAIDVYFLPGVFKLSEIADRIKAEIDKIGPVSLIGVDTSAAYNESSDENSNTEMGAHARRMRSLVNMRGGPCVLVACHPVKNAAPDNLQPRGGGAFIAEMDGNLTLSKHDAIVTLHWQGKFRGPDFAPIPFQLSSATTPKLVDSRGREIPTVIAKPMSERERREAEAITIDDQNALLVAIGDNDRASMADLAGALRWVTKKGDPNKSRVQKVANQLKKDKYVKIERGALVMTDKGKKEKGRVKLNADLVGKIG